VAGAVPLVLYLAWFDSAHDRVAFNSSSGVFLWSRTMTFADCHVPVMTADFSLRYVVPALPAISLAAAQAFLRAEPRTAPAPRPAQQAQRAGAGPRASIQRVSREHPAETTPCNYRVT
jgi:hypothetical protein